MPGTFQGSAARNSTATAWATGQSRSLGALCTPSTPNGLVFVCTTAGTTSIPEPGWNTPPYATLGTVFTDGGGVAWTCFGTKPGPYAPIIQQPVDADPPLAFPQVVPEQTIADQLAWIPDNVGLLASDNEWTGSNTFNEVVEFEALTAYQNYSSTAPAMEGLENTGSNRLLLMRWIVGTIGGYTIYGRVYADGAVPSGFGDTNGISITVNANWSGTNWAYDYASYDASLYTFGGQASSFGFYASGQASPWASSAWDVISKITAAGSVFYGVGNSPGVVGNGSGAGAGVYGAGENGGGPGGQFVASSIRGALALNASSNPSGPQEGDFYVDSSTHLVYEQSPGAGGWAAFNQTYFDSGIQTGIAAGSFTTVQGMPITLPAGFYKIDVWTIGTGSSGAYPNMQVAYNGVALSGSTGALLSSGGSGNAIVWAGSLPIHCPASGSVTVQLEAPSSGSISARVVITRLS